MTGSNRRHSRCKRDALPTELTTRSVPYIAGALHFTSPFLQRLQGILDQDPLLDPLHIMRCNVFHQQHRCKSESHNRMSSCQPHRLKCSLQINNSPTSNTLGQNNAIFIAVPVPKNQARSTVTIEISPTLPQTSPRFVAVLFTLTIFTSASLLFFVQPLFTRLVLPSIGGASAVWTTAMLFFQSVLIGGYLYAHVTTRYLPVRWQMGLHLALWAIALWFLPLALPDATALDGVSSPALQTLILYALGVGMPFAVLSEIGRAHV